MKLSEAYIQAAEVMAERGHYKAPDVPAGTGKGIGNDGSVCMVRAFQHVEYVEYFIDNRTLTLDYLDAAINIVDPSVQDSSLTNISTKLTWWSDTRESAEECILAFKHASELARADGN